LSDFYFKRLEEQTIGNYSVLMSVYYKADPSYLRDCLNSMMYQSYVTDDFVLVCDGELTDELDGVIDEFCNAYPDIFNVVRLKQNVGIGGAVQAGLDKCKNDIIIRMDSDDVSLPDRCETEVKMFAEDPQLDIIGGYIVEYDSEGNQYLRDVPLEHDEILKFSKSRYPFNNVTMAFKKSKAVAVGGYSSQLKRCEDYDFVSRMLRGGAKAKNSPKPMVECRLDDDSYKRRKSWVNTKSYLAVRHYLWKSGYCGFFRFVISCVLQLIMFVLPAGFTKFMYTKILRRKK